MKLGHFVHIIIMLACTILKKKSADLKPLTLISGLLTGRFYSETGEPTDMLLQTEASLAEGQRTKAQSEAEKLHFPPCNSQWSAAEGGRVWCTNKRYGNSSEQIKYYY